MDLVMIKQNVYRTFTGDFARKWVPAILTYSRGSKRKDIKALMSEQGILSILIHLTHCFILAIEENRLAMMCLFHLLCIVPKKKDKCGDFSMLLKEYAVSIVIYNELLNYLMLIVTDG